MKKLYIFLMAGAFALGAVSCSKDDNSNSNNNNSGGNNNPTIDVWAKSTGKFVGDVTNGQGTTTDMSVTVTKLSDAKVRITPGPENTKMQTVDVFVFKNDTSIYHQQGTHDGTFYVIANSNPPQIVYTQNSGSISFFGAKQ